MSQGPLREDRALRLLQREALIFRCPRYAEGAHTANENEGESRRSSRPMPAVGNGKGRVFQVTCGS
jgi:hypothetical protein